MRTIKFRAWDKKAKQFWTQKEMTDIGGFYYYYGVEPYNEEFELMQFTGLLDKNGKEIYEGDIIQWNSYKDNGYRDSGGLKNYRIYWRGGTCQWGYTDELGDDGMPYQLMSAQMVKGKAMDYEVIGNIYENPDLL